MLIFSLYGLSAPDPKLVLIRERKIKAMKVLMGDKWLLAKNIDKKVKLGE